MYAFELILGLLVTNDFYVQSILERSTNEYL